MISPSARCAANVVCASYLVREVRHLGSAQLHVIHELVDAPHEVVVRDDRRDRHGQSRGGRDERLCHSSNDHCHPTGSHGGNVAEGPDDPEDGPEQTDVHRRVSNSADDAREPLQARGLESDGALQCARQELFVP